MSVVLAEQHVGEHIVLSTEYDGRMITLAVITFHGCSGDRARIAVSGAPSIRVSRTKLFFNDDIKE